MGCRVGHVGGVRARCVGCRVQGGPSGVQGGPCGVQSAGWAHPLNTPDPSPHAPSEHSTPLPHVAPPPYTPPEHPTCMLLPCGLSPLRPLPCPLTLPLWCVSVSHSPPPHADLTSAPPSPSLPALLFTLWHVFSAVYNNVTYLETCESWFLLLLT